MNLAMFPYNSNDNKYISLIQDSIKKNNIKIQPFFDVIKSKKKFNNTEYFMLNWYESLNTNSLIRQTVRFIKKYFCLAKLKLSNKKIIWTIHNKLPHDDKYKVYSKILMRWLAKNSYKIVIHSEESRFVIKEIVNYEKVKDKIVYIPHPNYIEVYKSDNDAEKISGRLNLLFIGAIKPYKNVDLLINVFNELALENVTLTLCGMVSSKNYEDYIKNIINNNPKIITDFRFIEDDEINGLIKKSDILILPYDIKSSLNSGTIILAFSNKRTVLSPLIGTLKDFKNKKLFFSYEYENIDDHKECLKNELINIKNMYDENNLILTKMGEECYKVVKSENSLEKISDIFRKNIFNE